MLTIAMLLAAVALALPAFRHLLEVKAPEPHETRLEISTPPTGVPLEFALSPDGRYMAFVASGDGPQRLWVRPLDKTEATPLKGTEDADYPFWSPDSHSVAFTAGGKLKRIDIAGGLPHVLAVSSAIRGGAWRADGTILFNATLGPLSRVAASGGGEPVAVTRLNSQVAHVFPQFLPDGRHFTFYAFGTPDTSGIYLASLDGGEPKRLAPSDTEAAYLAPDMIVFGRGTALVAQHLDLQRNELTGEPMTVADPVKTDGVVGYGGFSISDDGRISYRSGGAGLRHLKWYDRTGKPIGVAGEAISSSLFYPELSPDDRRVAFQRNVQNNIDVWIMDLIRGGLTRFTTESAIDGGPIWSPDGMQIAFISARKGPYALYLKPSSNVGTETLLAEGPNNKVPQDWSRDGRYLLYGESNPKTGRDLLALPMTGAAGKDQKPIVVAQSSAEELNGQFSRDGHWVAYETNESGRFEIVVQPFPVATFKSAVSIDGGTQPRWNDDQKELYFIGQDGKMMEASITIDGPTLKAGTPVPLFTASPAPGGGISRQEYAVSRDGRFLINQSADTSTTVPITLILNWKPNR
jgi:Tol biopolymer transport system component